MKLWVTRTSTWEFDADSPPCPGLSVGKKERWDHRTFKSFEEYDRTLKSRGGAFTDKGTDHQVTADGIKRRMPDEEAWFIEITTLEELAALSEKHGDLIFESTPDGGSIEIYDDYRE